MSQPTFTQVQPISPILTNMLLAYKQADERFVASRIFPWVPLEKQSQTFFILSKKYWFIDNVSVRAPGDVFGRSGFGIETDTATIDLYGLEYSLPDETRANSQVPMALESVATQWLAQQALIRLERKFAAVGAVTSVWGTTSTPSYTWNDYANSDPVGDVRTGKRTISQATGKAPNMMAVGEIVDDRLVNHPDIIDRLKYTERATIKGISDAMASLFGVDQYLVASATYNTANEGQTGSYSSIFGANALLVYSQAGANMMDATGGKTFFWQDGGGQGVVRAYRWEPTKSDVYQLSEAWIPKITASDLGYFFLTVAA